MDMAMNRDAVWSIDVLKPFQGLSGSLGLIGDKVWKVFVCFISELIKSDLQVKDIRAQNVPTDRFFLKLTTK